MKRLFLFAAVLIWADKASTEILYVRSGDYSSIQSAIDDANDGDVVIVDPNRYYENINFGGKAITVRSTYPNDPNVVAATIIDGNRPTDVNFGSAVIFNSGEDNNSVLSGFTITGGSGTWVISSWEYFGPAWGRCGGGVVCYNMSGPTITKNVFVNNSAGQGGGIYVYGDPVDPNDPSNPVIHIRPVISGNKFINNYATEEHGFLPPDGNYPHLDHGDGGAIVGFQGCDPIITGNVIQGNQANWYGGGIHLRQWSNGLIENNRVVGNISTLGAGLHITYDSSPTIRGNTIEQNVAGSLGGGGIYVYNRSDPTIEKNLITGNICPNGAGIAVYFSSEPVIWNNLIVKNNGGAGVRVRGGSAPMILHNTISGNSALAYSGGIDCTENAAGVITNNIITGSGAGYGIYVDSLSSPTIRYNDVWDNGAGNYGPAIADQTGVNGNISVEPIFLDYDANDFHLQLTSGCINSGDPNFAGEPSTDYDGAGRDMGAAVDIGAYEVWPVWNVTSGRKYLRIQEAIDNANDGDRIIVGRNRYIENLNFNGKNIEVQSIDSNDWAVVEQTIIDGNGIDTVVVFESGEDANCILRGFTITDGNASSGYGGGIQIRNHSGPTILNNLITNNSAEKGAGICLYHSFSRILDNVIVNNRGTRYGQGGGMMIIDCFEDTNAVIANNIIAGNKTFYGGGIRIQNSTAQIVNNVIAYNRAVWRGIGIYSEGDAIANCIVWGHGGNMYDDLYQCTATYSCIESNVPGAGNISSDPCFADAGYWDDANTPPDVNDDFFAMGDYHLKPESLCVDAGDNNSVPAVVTTDFDGDPRVINTLVDIGADEFRVTIAADFNGDGIVDYADLFILVDEWLNSGASLKSDFDDNGIVNLADYSVFSQNWGWTASWY